MFGYDNILDIDNPDRVYKEVKKALKRIEDEDARGAIIRANIYYEQKTKPGSDEYARWFRNADPIELYETALRKLENLPDDSREIEYIIYRWMEALDAFSEKLPKPIKGKIMAVLGYGASLGLEELIYKLNPEFWTEKGMSILYHISSDPNFISNFDASAPHFIPAIPMLIGIGMSTYFGRKKHIEEQIKINEEWGSKKSIVRDARKGLEYLKKFEEKYRDKNYRVV
ncbi:hypothetical protein DRP07_09385 [Archaeoglobales archaeon]|nr:MAG: hypothetical protein DRP07_09385 [Archaeoglobales archaeon]